jgi:mannose-6-phosphate isomerase-like protein (cupin superfamily)
MEEMDGLTEPTTRIATKPGDDLVFRKGDANYVSDWHNPHRRQYLFILEGQVEVSVKDGSMMVLNPGDALLAEDMTGQGHITKSIGGPYVSVSKGIPD